MILVDESINNICDTILYLNKGAVAILEKMLQLRFLYIQLFFSFSLA